MATTTTTTTTILIIGAGQAGAEAALALREQGFAGRVVLAGDEACLPYERPPLSKDMLGGEPPTFGAYVRPAADYERLQIELLPADPVTVLDPAGHRATFASGREIVYTKCLLATGGRARSAAWMPRATRRCHTLRTLADCHALRVALQGARRIAIVGGGFLGLEAASTLRGRGLEVTVIEAAPRLLSRVLPAPLSAALNERHQRAGTRLLCDTQVVACDEGGAGVALSLRGPQGSERLEADLCLVAIGQEPRVELARAAGLSVANGICVDRFCRSSDPDIYAAGDCASTQLENGASVRTESWQNARDQARTAAANLLGGAQRYQPKDWFWTDQCGWNLQILGRADHAALDWVRRDIDADKFMWFGIRDEAIRQICAVNAGGELRAAGRALNRTLPDLAPQVADPSVSLRQLCAA